MSRKERKERMYKLPSEPYPKEEKEMTEEGMMGMKEKTQKNLYTDYNDEWAPGPVMGGDDHTPYTMERIQNDEEGGNVKSEIKYPTMPIQSKVNGGISTHQIGSKIRSRMGKKPITINDHLSKAFKENEYNPIKNIERFISSLERDEEGFYVKQLDFSIQATPNFLSKKSKRKENYEVGVSTTQKLAFTLGVHKKFFSIMQSENQQSGGERKISPDLYQSFSDSGKNASFCFAGAEIVNFRSEFPFPLGVTLYGFPNRVQRGNNYYSVLLPPGTTDLHPNIILKPNISINEFETRYENFGPLTREVLDKIIYPVQTSEDKFYVNVEGEAGKHLDKVVKTYNLAGLKNAFVGNKDRNGQVTIFKEDKDYLVNTIAENRQGLEIHNNFKVGFHRLSTQHGVGFIPWTSSELFSKNEDYVSPNKTAFESMVSIKFKFKMFSL